MKLPYSFQIPAFPEEDMIRQYATLIDGFEDEGDFILDVDIHNYRDITNDNELLLVPEKNHHSLYLLMDGTRYPYFKTQQTAPATMGFSIRGSDGKQHTNRYMFHFFQSFMQRIAEGQYRHLSKFCDKIILCQDDPGLGFVKQMIDSEKIVDLPFEQIVKMTDGIYPKNVIPAFHYCDDWRNLLYNNWHPLWESKLKVVHIDLVRYPPHIDSVQSEKINAFLEKGGGLVLGVLPNTDDAYQDTILGTLSNNLSKTLSELQKSGVDLQLIKDKTMISTQCGLSGASPKLTREIHEVSPEFSDIFLNQIKLIVR